MEGRNSDSSVKTTVAEESFSGYVYDCRHWDSGDSSQNSHPKPDADTRDLFSPISNNTINLAFSLNFGDLAKIKVGWQQF